MTQTFKEESAGITISMAKEQTTFNHNTSFWHPALTENLQSLWIPFIPLQPKHTFFTNLLNLRAYTQESSYTRESWHIFPRNKQKNLKNNRQDAKSYLLCSNPSRSQLTTTQVQKNKEKAKY